MKKRKNLMHRVVSYLLIAMLLTTQTGIAQAAQSMQPNKEQNTNQSETANKNSHVA